MKKVEELIKTFYEDQFGIGLSNEDLSDLEGYIGEALILLFKLIPLRYRHECSSHDSLAENLQAILENQKKLEREIDSYLNDCLIKIGVSNL